MSDRNLSRYERQSVEALAASETGVAFAKRSIRDLLAPMADEDEDGRPDFRMADTLAWGGSYSVIAEASDVKGMGITAYQSNGFTIVSEGRFQGAIRRVKVEIVHDSFLKYARFTALSDLTYECDANITGEVFVNGNLNIPCNCAATKRCSFLEMVSVVDDVPNAACGEFYRGYVTNAEPIDLENSFSWTDVRDKARGLGADNACERKGTVGLYTSLPGTDPLHLATQSGADLNVLVFDRLDFENVTTAPPDTCVRYNGAERHQSPNRSAAPMPRLQRNHLLRGRRQDPRHPGRCQRPQRDRLCDLERLRSSNNLITGFTVLRSDHTPARATQETR